ncbi:MAG: fluoride efflux transporter CrcB [Christensenellaceae bacterium]
MVQVILIGLGGFIGVIGRYGAGLLVNKLVSFPIGTLLINFIGSFLIGIMFELSSCGVFTNEKMAAAITVGVLGGFTTFSTFSLETLNLLEGGYALQAIINIVASVALCVLAVFLGKTLVRAFV